MPASPNTFKTSLAVYRRLLGYVRPFIGAFAVSILGYLLVASAQPMQAALLKFFVDGLIHPEGAVLPGVALVGGMKVLYAVPLMLVLIAVWQGVGTYLGNYFIAKVSMGVVDTLRRALFDTLLRLPNQLFRPEQLGSPDLAHHLQRHHGYGAATDAIKVVIREGLTVTFLFAYLLWMNWKLTLVMVVILPLIGLMVSSASRKYRKQSRAIQAAMGDVTHVASEMIQGYRVVRSFGGEASESARFSSASADNAKKQLRMVKTSATFVPALQLVTFTTMAVLLFLVLLLRGDSTPGDLVAYITAAGLLPKPIRSSFGSQLDDTARSGWQRRASSSSSTKNLKSTMGTIEREPGQRPPGGARPRVCLSRQFRAGARRHQLHRRAGPDDRAGRTLRQRQVDSRQPDPALLSPRAGKDPDRRRRRRGLHAAQPAPAYRPGHPAGHAVQRYRAANIAYGDLKDAPREAVEGSGRSRLRARIHRSAASGVRHPDRRKRGDAFRWAAPASGDRPRPAEGRTDTDSRRGDLGPRHGIRTPYPGGARPRDGQDAPPWSSPTAYRPSKRPI
jgi:hypothetical protein